MFSPERKKCSAAVDNKIWRYFNVSSSQDIFLIIIDISKTFLDMFQNNNICFPVIEKCFPGLTVCPAMENYLLVFRNCFTWDRKCSFVQKSFSVFEQCPYQIRNVTQVCWGKGAWTWRRRNKIKTLKLVQIITYQQFTCLYIILRLNACYDRSLHTGPYHQAAHRPGRDPTV